MVLIVAKCIVNKRDTIKNKYNKNVLIVAKCIVNQNVEEISYKVEKY